MQAIIRHRIYDTTHLAFNGSYRKSACGKAWVWDALKFGDNKYAGHPMVIMEISERFYRRFCRREGFFIPCWINGDIDLSVALTRIKQSKSIKSDVCTMRKNHLQYEVTRDKDEFNHFYHSMYVPYITKAHGDRASLHSYVNLKGLFSHGELILVKKDGEYITGELLVFEDNTVHAKAVGVKDGNIDYLKSGAVAALYYHGILYSMSLT